MANSGQTQNAAGFVMYGGGTMALVSPNAFTGPITISNGTVLLASSALNGGSAGSLGSLTAPGVYVSTSSNLANITNYGTCSTIAAQPLS